MNTKRNATFSVLAAVAGTIFTATAPAQMPLPIDPIPAQQTDWSCGDVYYVDVAGSDANAGTLASPWRTVTFALAQAQTLTPNGTPITINIMAGTYNANENFPIRLPARGIKLQAFEPGVTISGEQFEPVLRVNTAGPTGGACGYTPSTVIRGLTLTQGIIGLEIDTSLVGGAANTPDRVLVQRCNLVNNLGTGALIWTRDGRFSQHVIEDCEIAFNANASGYGDGVAMFNLGGTSSNLIRANNIHDNEVGIYGFGQPGTTEPRIFSNFVRDAEWGIALFNCDARCVNNTQGYGRPFTPQQPVYGVILAGGGDITLANNIIWNPPGYAVNASSVDDLENQSSGNLTNVSNYILSVVGAANDPQFLAPPTNLHVSATSPVLDAGTNGFMLPAINITVNGMVVRADCAKDVDGDSRIVDFMQDTTPDVEIGADERTDGGGNAVRLTSNQLDAFGNLHTNGVPTPVTLDMAGNPGDVTVIFFWWPSSLDPVPFHRFAAPLGSWSIPGSNVRRVGTGVIGAGGTFAAPLTVSPALGLELEWYFQGATLSAGGAGVVSNRLLLEINE